MRAMMVTTVGALLAFAVTYIAVHPATPEPVKPVTLADVARRRAAHEAATERREPAKPVRVSRRPVSDEPIGNLADAKEQLNRSMVGLPFAMSASVVATCKRWDDCGELDGFLERMAAEPRDPTWAPQIESYIVNAIRIEEEGALRIRALECRRTRCAIEVASEAQSGIQKSWDTRGFDVRSSWFSGYGREPDPGTGLVTMVQVKTWRRYSAGTED